jgi:hypothetical protein
MKRFLATVALSLLALSGGSVGFSDPAHAISCRAALQIGMSQVRRCRIAPTCIRYTPCTRSNFTTGRACIAYGRCRRF